MKKHPNHIVSFRLPLELHHWVQAFAAQWQVPSSYILRKSVQSFADSQSKQVSKGNGYVD